MKRYLFELMKGCSIAALALMFSNSDGKAQGADAGGFNFQCPEGGVLFGQPGFDASPIKCFHLIGSDGVIKMGDGTPMYAFGFSMDRGGVNPLDLVNNNLLGSNLPAPAVVVNEGDEVYLTMSNIGLQLRPDLFDAHSIHWHGFPNASAVFDGVPENTISPNPLASMTYYYKVVEPGTFMYHCHVEATEHMQMGMLGNLYVRPKQNGQSIGGYTRFAYNDGDGSTGYDVEYPLQIHGFDFNFHDQHIKVQALPFAEMEDTYPMLNGRGYPDTVAAVSPDNGTSELTEGAYPDRASQPLGSKIVATKGEKVLLRLSSLSTTDFVTLRTHGIPMKLVGQGSAQLRGPTGADLYYETNSVTLGGGQSQDVLLDTASVEPGTYYLYSSNLNYLNNFEEDFGGIFTEIQVN